MLPAPDTLEISIAEFQALRESAAPHRLIDCREAEEWDICHLAGAELAPLSRFAQEAPQRFAATPVPIIIYCHHGMRSGQAAHFLRQRGVEHVWSLAGGIAQWAEEVEPTLARY